MHNVWLIARREYVERIRTRGFLITTVMIPLVMGGLIYGSAFLGSRADSGVHIAVVSSDIQLALDLQTALQQQPRTRQSQPRSSRQSRIEVDAMGAAPQNAQATREILNKELDSGDLDGYLWITPAAAPSDRPTFVFTPRTSDQDSLRSMLAATLGPVLMREQLAHRGIVASDADTMLRPIDIRSAPAPHRANSESAQVSVTLLFFLMYMVIMLYGMNVARSIIEEKTSRIFEVMLATIRPQEMMAGKILGVGSVGLTQVVIWIAVALLASSSSIAVSPGGMSLHLDLTGVQIVYFFIFFILGYKYSKSMGATVLNRDGKETTPIMGSYGIGIERILTAAIEQSAAKFAAQSANDPKTPENYALPPSIAPFQVVVTITNVREAELLAAGEKIASELSDAGIDVLLDDRDERAGVKFKDAELIGVPFRIAVGKKLAEGKVELLNRLTNHTDDIPTTQVVQQVQAALA